MIDRQEILEFSREFSLRPDVIEKDYALGWLLAGIGQHAETKESWVFKGGTCLKKCYFETYRFSEDLDFTLLDPAHLNQDFLLKTFKEISEWVYEQSGLELPVVNMKFEIYQNPRGKQSAQGRVGYRGPMAPGGDLPRIKLDLTNDEKVVLKPVKRKVHHGYSDVPPSGIEILSYPFEEVFAEKVRALSERELPRDLYDVIHLYRHPEMRPSREVVVDVLREKCLFKGIPFPKLQALEKEPQRTEIKTEWSNMLAHQLPSLPPFESFWNELVQVFAWLESKIEPPVLQHIQYKGREAEDQTWAPSSVAQSWNVRIPLEVIRFAGANRLVVNLGYQGKKRLIEPYSLRRTQAGNILLHAIRVADGEHRSYKIDEIESAEVTNQTFTPRYTVELTPAGPVQAPLQERSRRSSSSYFGSDTKYIIRCSTCGKEFVRSSQFDTSLNKHKNKSGYECYGTFGQFVRQRRS